MNLFEDGLPERLRSRGPLASRLRPSSLDEVVGQDHLLGAPVLRAQRTAAQPLRAVPPRAARSRGAARPSATWPGDRGRQHRRARRRDAHYTAERIGHGIGYRYPHDDPRRWVQQDYLPDELVATRYYKPSDHGHEAEIVERLRRRDRDDG
ncbi:MAG: hypothetical protein ACLP8S_00995 [Solirubrobacteraceae bacterium]